MSDRVGSESFTPRTDLVRDDAAAFKSFEQALKSVAPQNATAAPTISAAAPSGARSTTAAARDLTAPRSARANETASNARPEQSARTTTNSMPVEGTLEGTRNSNAPKTANPDRNPGKPLQAANNEHKSTDLSANDTLEITLQPPDARAPAAHVARIAERPANPGADTKPISAEAELVIETLQGLADKSLIDPVLSRVRADATAQIAAEIAAGGDGAEASAQVAAVEDLLDQLSTLAADVLAGAPYDGIDFANLFDELFWIRNWLALFGGGDTGGHPIDFEQSINYSVSGAMMVPMEIGLTRALLEQIKPTDWDRKMFTKACGPDDPVDGPGADASAAPAGAGLTSASAIVTPM